MHVSIPVLLVATLAPAGSPVAQDDDVPAELLEAVEEIQAQVEAIRGLEFKRPVGLRVASAEDLSRYLAERMDEWTTPEELENQDLVAKLTGLLPADEDLFATQMELIESQVGGYYDPATDTFSLMEGLVGGGLARVILAHELTHALDDQHFDLDGGLEARKDHTDALWAYQSVVEGSATAVMNRWTLEQMQGGGGLSAADMEEAANMGADVLERMQPFLWKPMLGAYLRGSAFLAKTDSVLKASMTMPTSDELDRAFREPPLSSEQILHPERYWDADERDDPREVRLHLEGLPEDVSVLDVDTFGELQLGFVVEPPKKRKGVKGQLGVLGARYTSKTVEGWGGDRWALLARGEARALVLRTLWDDGDEAEEFADAARDRRLVDHVQESLGQLALARGLEASCYSVDLVGEEVRVVFAVGMDAEAGVALRDALISL